MLFQINCITRSKDFYLKDLNQGVLENRHPMHCDSQNSQKWQEFFDKTQFQALDLKSKTININTNNFKEIHIKKILHLLSNNLT